jgi:hypothetical protein
MARSIQTDIASISEAAISQLAQAVVGARYTTPTGKVIELDTDQHLRVLQWAAQQREKRARILESPDDLNLQPTRRNDAA